MTSYFPSDIDKGWFMFFGTLLNQVYWVLGATLGAVLGYIIHFKTNGIEFIMTAFFIIMFMNQWEDKSNHSAAIVGLGSSLVCLLIFGSENFMIPPMVLIILCFTLNRKKEKERK